MSAEPLNDLLGRLLDQAGNERKRRSLRIIAEVCDAQVAHNSFDFSKETIGKLSSKRGGVCAPSLRNRASAAHVALIDAYASMHRPASNEAEDPADELLDDAASPLHRARLRRLLARLNEIEADLKRERQRANALQHISDRVSRVTVSSTDVDDDSAIYGIESQLDLKNFERQALETILSTRWQSDNGVQADEEGRLVTKTGKTVLPYGSMSLLEKIAVALKIERRDSVQRNDGSL